MWAIHVYNYFCIYPFLSPLTSTQFHTDDSVPRGSFQYHVLALCLSVTFPSNSDKTGSPHPLFVQLQYTCVAVSELTDIATTFTLGTLDICYYILPS